MIASLQRRVRQKIDERIAEFLRRLFGEPVLIAIVREDSCKLPERDQMPLFSVSQIALISPEDKRVKTIPLNQTWQLNYGDRLHLVLDLRMGED